MLKIEMKGGWKVHLWQLFQRPTYADVLEGRMTRQRNVQIIESLSREMQRVFSGGPLLILGSANLEKLMDQPLPELVCMAEFLCFRPIESQDHSGSRLLVMWFQPDFDIVLPPLQLDELRRLVWPDVATDFML